MAAVHFRRGRIASAGSAATPRLGDLLVSARKLSPVALRAAAAARPADAADHLLADELVREGIVDAAAVEEALRRQAEATLLEILGWPDGEFAFNRDADDDAAEAHAVELDAQEVLLNVVRRLDEDGRAGPAAAAVQP
jgi:hypothetical protein